ncbi:hypothetical protein K440DRAFT_609920 [Wilcoxina mikolae CBS 423.85]|nr:hypothetical protein K440DRAFT_609920 [Wilcoxina mikolae CBS 423.85]
MPNKKKSSGSKKPKTQHHSPSNTQPSQACSASSPSGPSTTATDQPTHATPGPSTKVTYKGLRFPADNSPPDRIDYTTTEPTEGSDTWLGIAADFSPYWNGDYKARKTQSHVVQEQAGERAILDGHYVIYYTRNPNLPVNKSILSMPPMRAAVDKSIARGEKFEERLFWRGDVLVARLREPFETHFKAKHDDVSPQMVKPLIELLVEGFVGDWEGKALERFAEHDVFFEESIRKHERTKEELATSLKLPPGARENPEIESFLEMFAAMCGLGESCRQDDQAQEMR